MTFATPVLFPGNTRMHALVASSDWNAIGMPPTSDWPPELRALVRLMLESKLPMSVLWGEQGRLLYNDSYIPFLSNKHPAALGQPAQDVWPEIWDDARPLIDRARSGDAFLLADQRFSLKIGDTFEDAWFAINFAPIRGDDNAVRGIYSSFVETTHRVLAERRQSFLLALTDALRNETTVDGLIAAAADTLCPSFELDHLYYFSGADNTALPTHHHHHRLPEGGALPATPRLSLLGRTQCAHLAAGRSVAIDGTSDGLDPALRAQLAALGIGSLLAIPVSAPKSHSSVLVLARTLEAPWRAENVAIMADASERLGHAIDRIQGAQALQQLNQTLEERIEQRTAELAKAQSEALDVANRLNFVLDSAEIGDWDLNLSDDTAYRSLRHDRCFGYQEPIVRWGFEQFIAHVHPDDREFVEQQFHNAVAGVREWHFDCRVIWPDNSVHWIAAHGTIYQGSTGPRRMAGIVADITQRKLAEEELKQADQRKNEFLAMLAHELRNPLAPIGASAALLQTARLDPAQIARTGDIISRQVRHMATLVDELLDVSRVTRGQITLQHDNVDLRRVIATAIEQLRPAIDAKGHSITLAVPEQDAMIVGDTHRLVQVVGNILANAVKFTPAGGKIGLACAIEDHQVVLRVSDNGIGIAPDFIDHIFELFSQGDQGQDRSKGGLGIGLALARSLVDLHGGMLHAESVGLGHGCTLTLRLPHVALRDEPLEAASEASAVQQHRLKLLIVDDNVDAATTLAMLAQCHEHEALVEHDARQALHTAAREQPQVCLLDIGLPVMDGKQLVRAMRAMPEMAGSYYIAVTGYGVQEDRTSALEAGFDSYMVKPVDSEKLFALLATLSMRQGDAAAPLAPV